jgi:hypothetical protein
MAVIRRRKVPLLGGRRRGGSEQNPDAVAQKLADLPPYQRVWFAQVILGLGLLAGSSPVELAVPAIRALSRKRGVQTGAALGSLLSFLAGQAYSTTIRRQLDEESSADSVDRDHWSDRWMTRVIFSGAVVLPAAGAALPGTVVLRKRSPLWGLGLWLLVRLVAATVLAVDASRLKRRREAEEQAAAAGD